MSRANISFHTNITTKKVNAYADSNKRVKVDKVDHTMGSSAGAGSSEFSIYLNARNREKERITSIEETAKEEETKIKFAEKIELNRKEALEKTKKNAEKRNKKKLKRKLAKLNGAKQETNDRKDESEDDESVEV